jgi:hypothetical protein
MPKPCSRWPDTTVVDQSSAGTRTVDSEMPIAEAVDEDCDSNTSTSTNPHIQRGKEDPEKGLLGVVAPFIERNPDNMASTLEWRGRFLRPQEATGIQATTTSSRQQHAAEERRCASSEELEIERIRRHYQKQERILEEEIKKHEKRYKEVIEQLKKEDKDKVVYSADWWPVQPDYQPTECGDDESR